MNATILDKNLHPKHQRFTWLCWIILGFVALLVSGRFVLIPLWLPTAIVYAPNFGKVMLPTADPTVGQVNGLGISRQLRIAVDPPAASLSVWIMEPSASAGGPRGTILVLHGIRDRKDSMRGIGRMLAEAGYRAVLVDLRGHGRSSGDWLTYGVVDSHDLMQVLDHLDSVDLLDEPVGLFGCSYGGAVALQLAARDARVKSVVTVATFTSLDDAVGSSARQFAPGWMITPAMIASAVEEAGKVGHFQASQTSPLLAITRTQAKVLLIHGTEDRKLPCSFSQALHAAAKDHSQLILVQGADHDSIMRETTGVLQGPILAWLAKEMT